MKSLTYVWHPVKNLDKLKIGLSEINRQLSKIRNEGRLVFLESNPANFSRIFHDYGYERKGFVLWMNGLEERLM